MMLEFQQFFEGEGHLVFWVALFAFIFAVFLELWLRQKNIQKQNLQKPHSARIEFALHHLKHKDIKKITNDMWQKITGGSSVAATQDLKYLVDLGILRENGGGKDIYYTFVKHEK